VCVYTQSPTVRSGDFSFSIVKLILPEPIPPDPSIGSRTRFEFPFDNPKKAPSEAYAEIAAGLNDLDETTLLFLSSLQAIKWHIAGADFGQVHRRAHSISHLEIEKQRKGSRISGAHFLKFDQSVPGQGAHRVAVAFPLEFLAGIHEFDAAKPLAAQLRIATAPEGRVAVFFVAAKETSGLRFHLDGPFVPELSRASIKETPTNEPLFKQLAALCAGALHHIRDLGLLTAEFLAILPNPQDQMPPRYQPIRAAIIDEMKSEPLTPTHERSHAAANRLVQAKASLKSLLSHEDLEFLVEYEEDSPLWAMGATQRNNRIDNFLSGLEIPEWGVDHFVDTLRIRAGVGWRQTRVRPYWVTEPDQEFMQWLGQKPPEWLQHLYSLLHDEAVQSALVHRIKDTRIVRLQDGTFGVASECFFANNQSARHISVVDAQVYTRGTSRRPRTSKMRT
jgi:hypothetical protein